MAEARFTSFGAELADLEAAWQARIDDARALHEASRFSMSIAMGVYALEILLKCQICRNLDLESLPVPFQIHDLESLLILAGLRRELRQNTRVDASWSRVKQYHARLNDLRYGPELLKENDSKGFHRSLWADVGRGWAESKFGVIPSIKRQS